MSGASTGNGWREHLLLFGRFLRHPRTIGAIAPSSAALAEAMVDTCDLTGAVRAVELGPGTGVFTTALLERLGPSGRLLAIDREPAFVARLQERFPRVECVCASAAELPELASTRGLLPVDVIISGLPFACLPAATTREILEGIQAALRPGGGFSTFQYVHAYRLPTAAAFRRAISERMGSPPVRRLVVKNLPPAYVLSWTKTKSFVTLTR
jgi:phospholipid N-methyltransferase